MVRGARGIFHEGLLPESLAKLTGRHASRQPVGFNMGYIGLYNDNGKEYWKLLFRIWGCRVQGLGLFFEVYGLGFRVYG